MKFLVVSVPLLMGLPGVLAAQARVHISAPTLRVSLGPLDLRATLERGGVAVRAAPASPRAGSRAPAAGREAGATAARILTTADRYVGTRYTYGGESPAGFDCSGFVQYVYGRHGVALPRTSRQQAAAGVRLPAGEAPLRPGDLMLFASSGGAVDHVAIYAGDGRILHSSASGGGVGYDDLDSPRGRWFLARHVASRRVI